VTERARLSRPPHDRLAASQFGVISRLDDQLIAVPDAWWHDAGVAVEVDSREWHLSPGDWERTMRRHAELTALGILVSHFSPRQIRTEPERVLAAIRAALDAGRPVPGRVTRRAA
jgi:very-short-patch-repair endonuclease